MNKFLSIFISAVGCTLLAACVAYTAPASQEDPSQGAAQDRLTHPPETQSVNNGSYELLISAVDQWQTPTATATFSEGDTPLWQHTLPHQYGPKFALVSPIGQTILFDEYINIASDHAIALIDATGETTITHSFDDIHTALQQSSPDITRADLTSQATTGWWIAAAPTLNDAGTHALIETGGTTLQIDLTTGELSAGNL